MNDVSRHVSMPMGIHRLFKEPYDDKEVFESVKDLINYCSNGARYNGQHIKCKIGNTDSYYIQKFIICNDTPVIEIPNGDLITDNDNNILIYYYNPIGSNSSMYDTRKSYLNYFEDPFKFSILDLIDIFKTNNSYNFKLVRTDPITKTSITITWSQSFNPITESNKYTGTINEISYINDDKGVIKGTYTDPNSSESKTYYLIPKTIDENIITKLYITQCSNYIINTGLF